MNQKQMDSVAAHLGGGRPNFSVELMVRHNRTANAFNRPNDPETPSGSRATQLATPAPQARDRAPAVFTYPNPKFWSKPVGVHSNGAGAWLDDQTTVPGRDQVELSMWCSQPTTIYVPVHNILVSDRQMAFRSTYVRARSSVFWGSVLFLLFCLGRPSERPETFSDPSWDGWICRPVPSVRTGH